MHAERAKKLGLLRDADGAHPAPAPGGTNHGGRTQVGGGRVRQEEERMSQLLVMLKGGESGLGLSCENGFSE